MIKKIAWDTFKNTGDINTYLELKQIENIEEKIGKNDLQVENTKVEEKIEGKEGLFEGIENGNSKGKGNHII